MPRTLYIEVANGKSEIIRKITDGKTSLRPDWDFVSTPEGANVILTDNPAKFYPAPKHTSLYCTHDHGMVDPGKGWGVRLPSPTSNSSMTNVARRLENAQYASDISAEYYSLHWVRE